MPTPTHRSAREDVFSIADGWLQVVSTHHQNPREDVLSGDVSRPLDLVFLDMDGTLVEGSSWEVVHAAMGVDNQANWQRYQRGELDDRAFMRSDIALWLLEGREVHVSDVEVALDRVQVMDGAREVVSQLRDLGIATCILSGGLDLLARRVCLDLGIDMYVANGLRLEASGLLQGEGIPFVEVRNKGLMAREVLRKLGVRSERSAAVGNSAYDVPMFRASGFGVAFNPSDDWVRRHARHVVEGVNMRPVAPFLLG